MKKIIIGLVMATTATLHLLAGSTTLYFENDVFHDRDYDYTHGTKITTTIDNEWSVFLWQGMYTPGDKESEEVVQNERPYAGWLAIGVANQYFINNVRNLTEVSIGVVGPSALAEETQTAVHDMLGCYVLKGWDNQLRDELAFTLRQEVCQAFWLIDNKIVFVPQTEMVVGTVMDHIGLGADIMFGLNPDPYPYPSHYISVREKKQWSIYGFTGVRGRYVFWNMLLEGNIWHDSHSVEREPMVGELYAGFCVASGWGSFAFTDIVRTREFETQDKKERFACVTMTVNF